MYVQGFRSCPLTLHTYRTGRDASWAEEHIIIPFILQVVQCHLKFRSLATCGTATVVVVMVVMDVRSMMCVSSLP